MVINILIAGGTGFVGSHLTDALLQKGHQVFVLTRSPDNYVDKEYITYIDYEYNIHMLPTIHAVINLAGDPLFGYWTRKKKKSIVNSRIETTKRIVKLMEQMKVKPDIFISGSAIGYYGPSDDTIFTEKTIDPGNDFLSQTVLEWENTAKKAEKLGIRTVYTRFGLILGKQGSLPYMSLPIKLFAGGPIGSGEQWMSWVHIDDAVQLIIFCLFNEKVEGPINITAPNPKRNKDFVKILARTLKRPFWFPAPNLLLRITIGEMSGLITNGQYVYPKKAKDLKYEFLYPNLRTSLEEIYSKK